MITSATPAEARERASSLIWIFWVGAPCVAWVVDAGVDVAGGYSGAALLPAPAPAVATLHRLSIAIYRIVAGVVIVVVSVAFQPRQQLLQPQQWIAALQQLLLEQRL